LLVAIFATPFFFIGEEEKKMGQKIIVIINMENISPLDIIFLLGGAGGTP